MDSPSPGSLDCRPFAVSSGPASGADCAAGEADRVRSDPSGSARPRRPIPPKLYRIGEVVDYSGVSRQTIHNYTVMGLLHESRWTSGGHRLYDESVFQRLDEIAELKAGNRTLQEIREHFAGKDMG